LGLLQVGDLSNLIGPKSTSIERFDSPRSARKSLLCNNNITRKDM
jgi:hypothetical protein